MPLVLVAKARCSHSWRSVINVILVLTRATLFILPRTAALVPVVSGGSSRSHLVCHLLENVGGSLVSSYA